MKLFTNCPQCIRDPGGPPASFAPKPFRVTRDMCQICNGSGYMRAIHIRDGIPTQLEYNYEAEIIKESGRSGPTTFGENSVVPEKNSRPSRSNKCQND